MSWQDRDYNREEAGASFGRWSGMSVVTWLIIINAAIWIWDAVFGGSHRASQLALFPYANFNVDEGIRHLQLWRLLTYQFIHAGFLHIALNMYGLFAFGPIMENWWGPRKFLAFYLLCGMSGGVVFTILGLSHVIPADGSLVGASGAIFGILVGCAIVAPRLQVMLMFPPIPMTMRTMALVFLAIAAATVIFSGNNAGGEAAHLGGAALGFVLVKWPWLLGMADRFSLPRREEATRGRWMKKREQVRREQEDEQAEVDRILDKVRDHGVHSLTRNEKKVLQRATEKQRRAG